MAMDRIQRRIENLLDEADAALVERDWATVLDRAETVLALDPDNAEALTFFAAAERSLADSPAESVAPGPALHTAPDPPVPVAPKQPTSFANGRYQVKELLGEGGRKRVYQAHDTVLDRDVALAAIKTEGLDPTSRVRITREAQAMGRLGDHPHVLSIHDLGDEAGQPYMVLPLMPGGDVESLLEVAEDRKLPLERAIDLAAQICRGLEFAHSKGIVHRDLKPGNVWLTADGTARIGDFGLAVAIDRSRLTQEGMMVGTVSYMPPEQAMGGEVTPQSDLYSLGAMLYEMVCGRPPFLGDDSVAIIGQHINTPPVAPTWHNSDCPRALEALILRLLTKDPSERPESAADVLTALEGIDLTADVGADEHDETHALDSLAGGVFVGRQREMGELKAALEDALSGRGRLVTLVGEPGIGKTRTAEELATYARLRGCQVLSGRCYEEQGVPPYWPWVQAIRGYVRGKEPEQLRSEMGAGAADIAEIVSDVRARMPDLEPPPRLDSPEQARFRLFDSVVSFLTTASLGQPIVLILDDLHWSDTPSLMLLQFVARELAGVRLLLVGTYRDVELNRQHPLAETLAELTRERLFERVVLRGLSEGDVSRFIEVTSGITPPRTLAQAVHRQTEGNPLFVTEVVRLLVQEGELTQERARERESWEIRIPEGVKEVIGRRLNRLSERCNDTLTVASVMGREFALDELDRVIDDLSQDRILDVLEEALEARLVEELPTAVGRYQFTHALVQETLSAELTLTRRVRLHARIAETLEELWADDLDTHAAELAHHFAQAETLLGTKKLVKYSIAAGYRALGNHAHEDALNHFQRAQKGKDQHSADIETADIHHGLGLSHMALHMVQATLTHFKCAFDLYYSNTDIVNAIKVASYPLIAPGASESLDLVEKAIPLVAPESHESGVLLSKYGFCLSAQRRPEDGFIQLERAIAIGQRQHDGRLQSWSLYRLGFVCFMLMRWEEGLERSQQALTLAEATGDTEAQMLAHAVASIGHLILGNGREMESHAIQCMDMQQALRTEYRLHQARNVNILRNLVKGDWETAIGYCHESLVVQSDDVLALSVLLSSRCQTGDEESDSQTLGELLESRASLLKTSWSFGAYEGGIFGFAIPMVSYIVGNNEQIEVAESIANHHIVADEPGIVALEGEMMLGLIGVVDNNPRGMLRHYNALEPYTGLMLCLASVDRMLGLFAKVMGNLDAAARHFEDALAFCRRAGYRPELAWSLCDYADMLLERNQEDDRQKAATLLDESLAISSDLGMRPLMERVLSRKMSLQGIDVSSPETSIDAVVSAVEVERPNLQPHAAPDGTVTIMFTDIEGSTAMTERLGDLRAQEMLRIHNAIIREQVAAHQGFEVKSEGDGFMLAFSSARRALRCAVAIQKTLAAHNDENPEEPIKVRIGLHTGEAIKEGEDFFGKTVILGARIASQAVGGQILVSSLLKALVESSGEFEFGDAKYVELKGLSGLHQVLDVRWDEKA